MTIAGGTPSTDGASSGSAPVAHVVALRRILRDVPLHHAAREEKTLGVLRTGRAVGSQIRDGVDEDLQHQRWAAPARQQRHDGGKSAAGAVRR